MLDKSRAADSGLKLKVNEQILDSCTELMKYIRQLVQKSRLLQKEIVEQGRVWEIYVNIYLEYF
jgi:huntingtin interacting protein 1